MWPRLACVSANLQGKEYGESRETVGKTVTNFLIFPVKSPLPTRYLPVQSPFATRSLPVTYPFPARSGPVRLPLGVRSSIFLLPFCPCLGAVAVAWQRCCRSVNRPFRTRASLNHLRPPSYKTTYILS